MVQGAPEPARSPWGCLLSLGLPVMVLSKAMGYVLHGRLANRGALAGIPEELVFECIRVGKTRSYDRSGVGMYQKAREAC